jgi:malate synthase
LVLLPDGVELRGPRGPRYDEILTMDAIAFLADLHRTFDGRRRELLEAREARRAERLLAERPLGFLTATAPIRDDPAWRIAEAPSGLRDRRVEITGPTDRKMMINALNSGATCFMADLEDATSPTWGAVIGGQLNLLDAVRGTISVETPDKRYELSGERASLLVRPRGWHLVDDDIEVDGRPLSGSLLDLGLFAYHNAREQLERGAGPWFYLPKLESHLEARLWNDVFDDIQDTLGIPRGTFRATVLIETLPAAFEMEEILFELRTHASGLNAGRWDYIFSTIKELGRSPDAILPDRSQVTMTVPFMRAYTDLLVRTCHRRGAHAMGGMAAFIPNRRDPEATERALTKVREDKEREATDGFDGTWVAHPDLVPVARAAFDEVLGHRPDQKDRLRDDVAPDANALQDLTVPGGEVTLAGVRANVRVALLYIESWLRGVGAVAIDGLMEDAATAEIARSQIWQWRLHGVELAEGQVVTRPFVGTIVDEELARIRSDLGEETYEVGRFATARAVFEEVALGDDLIEFTTLPASRFLAGAP